MPEILAINRALDKIGGLKLCHVRFAQQKLQNSGSITGVMRSGTSSYWEPRQCPHSSICTNNIFELPVFGLAQVPFFGSLPLGGK